MAQDKSYTEEFKNIEGLMRWTMHGRNFAAATKLDPPQRWMKPMLQAWDFYLQQHAVKFKVHKKNTTPWTVNVILIGRHKMKILNAVYRGKPYPTDVLSFPALQWSAKNRNEALQNSYCLGDIVICVEKIFSQAREHQLDPMNELWQLMIHGFVHLLGFDHERSKRDALIMEEVESAILDQFRRKMGQKIKQN